ncbi:ABC transporter ATP-binding protein/permease [Limosilactobacillus mucosae]|jgi:ABC-type lipoprotein export system ATPase subunit/ABC-type antimicrobial peptide transport system permease subunit|uniref:ABC transporter ATP-binding protein/permease n=1 Tax=Limosilactobacillus mucosae TaxID=97478 RepID=UPI0022E7F642|nr:ABC transporter ATP-binding protein/permease [Limosilactobacillus mucosae]
MAYLELHDIHKSYFLGKEEFPVLKGINLEFERGEFVSILGESGGGKSTLMNIIGGLDREFDGEVIVDGQKLDHRQEKQMDNYRRATIGYIYQAYNLIAHLTVLENVLISLDMTDLTAEDRKKRAVSLLEKVGLKDQLRKYPHQLSGGQKQRVAIARALASDPQVIIADEPTGALDRQNTQEVLELLDSIAKDGKLVIAVTHSQDVANHGTRIVHLADGVIDGDQRLRPAYDLPQDPTQLNSRPLPALASFKTAFKHFKYNFWRNSLIMLGTAIGLFAVLLFSGLGNGVNGYIENQINSLANPQVITVLRNTNGKKMNQDQLQASMQNMAANPQAMFLKNQDLNRLKNIADVAKVQPGYSIAAYKINYQDKVQSGTNLNSWSKAYTTNSIKKGHVPHANQIVLNKQQAIQLAGAKHYQRLLNQTVTITFNWVNDDGQPTQSTRAVKVVGFTSGVSATTAMSYQTIKSMLNESGASTQPNYAAVSVKSLDQVDKTATKINNLRDIKTNKRILGAITVGSMLKTVNTYVQLATIVLAAIAGISLLVSALMIIVTMYMSVSERTKEIGVLRALGERKVDIRRLFTAESLFIGFFAAILALVLAYGAQQILNHELYHLIKYDIVQISLGNVLFALVSALLIAFLAALLPARRAARLNPIKALAAD